MELLPIYLEKDDVVAVGEIGFDDQTPVETRYFSKCRSQRCLCRHCLVVVGRSRRHVDLICKIVDRSLKSMRDDRANAEYGYEAPTVGIGAQGGGVCHIP
jgi:predicted metal-dependent TIM-barrel fold hydrolase